MFQGDCQLPCLSVLPFSLFSSGVVSFAILLGGGGRRGGFRFSGRFGAGGLWWVLHVVSLISVLVSWCGWWGVGVGRCSWRLLLWVFDVWYRSVLVGAYMGVLFLDSRVPQLFRVFTIQMVYSGFHCLWEATCVGVHRTHSLPWHCTV